MWHHTCKITPSFDNSGVIFVLYIKIVHGAFKALLTTQQSKSPEVSFRVNWEQLVCILSAWTSLSVSSWDHLPDDFDLFHLCLLYISRALWPASATYWLLGFGVVIMSVCGFFVCFLLSIWISLTNFHSESQVSVQILSGCFLTDIRY